MTALYDDFSSRMQLEVIAGQVQQLGGVNNLRSLAKQVEELDRLEKLRSLAKQVEEWERLSSVSRLASATKNFASAFKQEYDLILRRVDLELAAYRETKSLGRRISLQALILHLRCLVVRPIRRFALSLAHALAGCIPASPFAHGEHTWQIFVAHPPIAPPCAI